MQNIEVCIPTEKTVHRVRASKIFKHVFTNYTREYSSFVTIAFKKGYEKINGLDPVDVSFANEKHTIRHYDLDTIVNTILSMYGTHMLLTTRMEVIDIYDSKIYVQIVQRKRWFKRYISVYVNDVELLFDVNALNACYESIQELTV